ncbi:MAG TPA: uracil-DNA glycosylase [Acidimicrobiia bacterium]|nr:uracil-DNA glycosylase [Acidimicrobiia bacterium]
MTSSRILLEELGARAAVCTACSLAATRNHVVFADGNPEADLMFVGEAPGSNEDLQGLPFVGAAGKLLDRLLGEIGIKREDVYIANVIKCRPPGNRDPRPEEIDACQDFLRMQLSLVDPRVVVTLGNVATKLLLKRDVGITRLRGQAYPWWNRQLVPTFHPAAALRGGDRVLEEMRQDFALVATLLRTPPAADPVTAAADPEQLGLFE